MHICGMEIKLKQPRLQPYEYLTMKGFKIGKLLAFSLKRFIL